MYFGGIWGGQLQSYRKNQYDKNYKEPSFNENALGPRVAKLSDDLKSFVDEVVDIEIVDEQGNPLLAGDNDRRFFVAFVDA